MSALTFDELLRAVSASAPPAVQPNVMEPSLPQAAEPLSEPSSTTHPFQAHIEWLPNLVDFSKAFTVSQKPVDFVIKDLLVSGRAANLTGIGGSSKTTMLIMLAIQVALGEDLLGWQVQRPGHAVLILAEETAEDVQRLYNSIANHLSLSHAQLELLCERLHVHAAAGYSCRLVDKAAPEQSKSRLANLVAHCKALGEVSFIGLDPAIALSGGRELDELDQRELAMAVDGLAIATGAAVVLVSHAAKSVQYQAEIGSHHSRGSGALTDALRLEMLMRVMTSKEALRMKIAESERHSYVRFQVTKANRLPPQAMGAKWFIRQEGGMLAPVPTLSPAFAIANDAAVRPEIVLRLFLTPEPVTGELQPQVHKFGALKAKLVAAGLVISSSPGGEEMAARRLLQRPRDEGYLSSTGQGQWQLTAKGLALIKPPAAQYEETDEEAEDEAGEDVL